MTDLEKQNYISLARATEGTPYSQEYLSLLVRKGKIDAKKFGRNWYATKASVQNYLRRQQEAALRKANLANDPQSMHQNSDSGYATGKSISHSVSDTAVSAQKRQRYEKINPALSQISVPPYGKGGIKAGRHFSTALASFARHAGADGILIGGVLAGSFVIGAVGMNIAQEGTGHAPVGSRQAPEEVNLPDSASFLNSGLFSDVKDVVIAGLQKSNSDFSGFAALADQQINFYDRMVGFFAPLRIASSRVVQTIADFFSPSSPVPLPAIKIVKKSFIPPVVPTPLLTANILAPSLSSPPASHTASQITQIRQIIEKKEVIIPADFAIVKSDVLASVAQLNADIRAYVNRQISGLSSSVSTVSGRAESGIQMVSVSQDISNLISPTIQKGFTLASGDFAITKGSINIASGNITADAITVRNNLAAGGDLSIGGGDLVFGVIATTTIPANAINAFSIATSTTAIPFMTFDTANYRVGIGTTSPSATLSVAGNIFASGTVTVFGSGTTTFAGGVLANGIAGGAYAMAGMGQFGFLQATSTTATSTFSTGGLTVGANQFVVQQNSGNVGIGTTSPGSLFSIQGVGNFVSAATSTIYTSLLLPNFSATSTIATSTIAIGGFNVGTGRFIVQQNSGNIGVGTSSPGATVDVVQNTNGMIVIRGRRVTDVAPTGDFLNFTTADGATALFRVDNSGNVYQGGVVNSGAVSITSVSTPQLRVQYNASNEQTTGISSAGATSFGFNGTTPTASWNPQSNSVNTFSFNDASSNSVLSIDTTNRRVGVSSTTPLAALAIGLAGSPSGGYYFTNGGLGIGTSTPGAAIAIATTTAGTQTALLISNLGSGYTMWAEDSANDQTPFVIDGAGNVGIGTTSPSQLLAVAGHCVTGDTLLKRRRRKKKADGTYEDEFDDVRIDQIKEGDEILTLDEQTGKLVVSRVNALMDMGIKPIYKLTTASGKTIRTTAEHPYLVKNIGSRAVEHASPIAGAGWLVASAIAEGDVIATSNTGSKITKSRAIALIDYANIKSWLTDKKLRIDLDVLHSALVASGVQEVRFYYGSDEQGRNASFFGALRAMGYAVITKPVQYFVVRLLDILQRPRNRMWLEALPPVVQKSLFEEAKKLDARGIGLFEPKANFDVEITADALEMSSAYDTLVLFSGDGDFTDLARRVRAKGKRATVVSGRKFLSGILMNEADTFVTMERLVKAVPGMAWNKENAKPAVVRQVLKNGSASIAGLLGLSSSVVDNSGGIGMRWERVEKIEHLPVEQVYDIEVEGTHNFIGNDIVAHNTYITGGLGIGRATTTSGALDVSLGGVFGGQVSAPTFNATSTTASSTFAGAIAQAGPGGLFSSNGITLTGGSFLQTNTATSTFSGGISTAGLASSNGLTLTGGNILSTVSGTSTALTGNLSASGISASNGLTVSAGNLFTQTSGTSTVVQGLSATGIAASAGLSLTGGGLRNTVAGTSTLLTGNLDAAGMTASNGLTLTGGNIFNKTAGTSTVINDLSAAGGLFSNGLTLTGGNISTASTDLYIQPGQNKNTLLNSGGGNVGIGTTAPNALLHIYPSSGTATLRLSSNSSTNATTKISLANNSDTIKWQIGTNAAVGAGFEINQGDATNNRFYIDQNGNVGIGTTGPIYKLQVAADVNTSGDYGQVAASGGTNGNLTTSMGYDTTGDYGFITALNRGTGYKNLVLQRGGGNVGIGTTGPTSKLHIKGATTGSTPYITFQSAFATNSFLGVSTQNNDIVTGDVLGDMVIDSGSNLLITTNGNNERMRITGTGNVGIGTTVPALALDVRSASAPISWGSASAQYGILTYGVVVSGDTGDAVINAPTNYGLAFQPNATTAMVINKSGNVGIGTTSPSKLLSVSGNTYIHNGSTQADLTVNNGAICADNNGLVKCTGALTAGTVYGDTGTFAASDLAENYPLADTSIEEGDIVMAASSLSSEEQAKRTADIAKIKDQYAKDTPVSVLEALSGSVAKADISHATQVIGVISTKPGLLLGDTTGFKLDSTFKPVALTGRVPVKVSLENGIIAAGDRITVSSVAGIGAKATTSGMTIGIALENYNENSSGEWISADNQKAAQSATFGESQNSSNRSGLVPICSIASGQNMSSTTVDNSASAGAAGNCTPGVQVPTLTPDYPSPNTTSSYQAGAGRVKTGKILVFVNLGYTQLDSAIAQSNGAIPTNAWSVDQSSGRVNVSFYGSITMQGNALLDVGKMTGYLGKWSIDEDGVLMAVKIITNEMIAQRVRVEESATFGTAAKPIGMTLYDESTGSPYCVKVKSGALVSEAGICGASQMSNAQAPMTNEAPNSNVQTATSTSVTSEPTASSTPID